MNNACSYQRQSSKSKRAADGKMLAGKARTPREDIMIKSLGPLAYTLLAALGTNSCLAEDLEETCVLPLKSIQKAELESIEYDGNSQVISSARLKKPSVNCASGYLKLRETTLYFHRGQSIPEEVVTLEKSDVFQRHQRYELNEGSALEISERGYIKRAEDIEKAEIQRGSISLTLRGATDFDDEGELLESEIFTVAPSNPGYLGREVDWDIGNSIYFGENGNFYIDGSPDPLSGIWHLDAQRGNLKISIRHNGKGTFRAYYISGSIEIFGESLTPLTSGEAISREFFPALESPLDLKFKFSQKVEKMTKDGTSVVYVEKIFPARVSLDSKDGLKVTSPNLKPMEFEKAPTFQAAFENLILILKFLISLVLTVFFSLIAIALSLNILRWFSSTKKIDRRYKKQGYAAPFFRALGLAITGLVAVFMAAIFFEQVILSALNISWPITYINYALF